MVVDRKDVAVTATGEPDVNKPCLSSSTFKADGGIMHRSPSTSIGGQFADDLLTLNLSVDSHSGFTAK